jgi:adenosylhomocysteine nucleosidase
MSRIAIVAALEREVRPLVRDWPSTEKDYEGRRFRCFENEDMVVVCGGIGAEAARRATEAVIALYSPATVYSAGFAGALRRGLKVGTIVLPRRVVDATDGSSLDTGMGKDVLVSCASVADPEQKARLAAAYDAVAVDMEASAVARGAQARGVRFVAIKAISDEVDFPMPPMERFVHSDGRFRTAGFVWFALLRPWCWQALMALARNSGRAAHKLCDYLKQMDHASSDEIEVSGGRSTK